MIKTIAIVGLVLQYALSFDSVYEGGSFVRGHQDPGSRKLYVFRLLCNLWCVIYLLHMFCVLLKFFNVLLML